MSINFRYGTWTGSASQPSKIVQEWAPDQQNIEEFNDLPTEPANSSVGRTWSFPNQHYGSISDYRIDPIFINRNNCQQLESTKTIDKALQSKRVLYSTENKAFYPITPYNAVPKNAPIVEFDITELGQTDVHEVISWHNPNPLGAVLLEKMVHSLMSKIGAIQTHNGKTLGTCTLISSNLVMTARHVIEGEWIPNLPVRFNYNADKNHLNDQSFQTALDYVVEDDPEYDYAIIKLKTPMRLIGYADLNTGDPFPGATVLLHYPLQGRLKVSVNTFDQQADQYSYHMRCFHDSDYCSSGGSYFDPLGRFTAMHLGAECAGDGFNLHRYAIKLQDIVARHPNSLLSNLSVGNMSSKNYLEPHFRNFLIDKEGLKSQKLFTDLLGNAIKTDKKISLTGANVVAYSDKNLDHLYKNHYKTFNEVYNKCLYLTGKHAFTKQYNMKNYIESDHVIPHHVWASTNLKGMKKLVKGNEERPGENEMPAITIPYFIHRKLRTTGGVTGFQQFHQKLINLCNEDKVHKAFIECIKEYQKKGINLTKTKVKTAIQKCLDMHISMGVIKAQKRPKVIAILP